MQEFIFLKQAREFLDAQLEVVNDTAQSLSLDGNAAVHRDHNSCMISRTHVDCMTTCLSSELKPQALCDSG